MQKYLQDELAQLSSNHFFSYEDLLVGLAIVNREFETDKVRENRCCSCACPDGRSAWWRRQSLGKWEGYKVWAWVNTGVSQLRILHGFGQVGRDLSRPSA
jgi:hypothetical protein